MAKVKDVCISEKKGEQKHPVDEVLLKVDHGIVGDAHAGNWHRQVSLLAAESVHSAYRYKAADWRGSRGSDPDRKRMSSGMRYPRTRGRLRDAERRHFCKSPQRGESQGRR